jgi:hypothetical protein
MNRRRKPAATSRPSAGLRPVVQIELPGALTIRAYKVRSSGRLVDRRSGRAAGGTSRTGTCVSGPVLLLPHHFLLHFGLRLVLVASHDSAVKQRSWRRRSCLTYRGVVGPVEGTLETKTVKFSLFTRLQHPTVRAGPALASDFIDHGVLAFLQIVRVFEVLDTLRPVGGDDTQLVPTGRHLLRFTAEIMSSALEPPKHVCPLPSGSGESRTLRTWLKPDTTYLTIPARPA